MSGRRSVPLGGGAHTVGNDDVVGGGYGYVLEPVDWDLAPGDALGQPQRFRVGGAREECRAGGGGPSHGTASSRRCGLPCGHTAIAMLNGLTAEDSASGLERRLCRLCRPRVLCVDEVGYLFYGNRRAGHIFEAITRRYEV